MNGPTIIMLIALGVVILGCSLAYVALTRRPATEPEHLVFRPAGEGQWTGTTVAGGVVITRVLDDRRGWVHEVETNFRRRPGDRGDMVRLHYLAPSWPYTEETIRRLADAHLAGEPQSGQSPRDLGLYS